MERELPYQAGALPSGTMLKPLFFSRPCALEEHRDGQVRLPGSARRETGEWAARG